MKARAPRFERDRDRILGSRAFRRLAGKTQVVALPSEPLVRTRLTHTLEVSSIAREIGRGLTEPTVCDPLVEAIALGHDLGHPAFAHAGEKALASIVPGGFHHAAHGVRVVTELEPELDLAPETIEGILKHSKGRAGSVFARSGCLASATREALVVRAADVYAYASHDLDDAYLLGLLCRRDVPRRVGSVFGAEPADVRRVLVERTIASSNAHADVSLDEEAEAVLSELRSFLFERLYEARRIASQTACVRSIVEWLWEIACHRPRDFCAVVARLGLLPSRVRGNACAAVDFVDAFAAMTDRQVLDVCRALRPPTKVTRAGGPMSAPRNTSWAGRPPAIFRMTSP
jgi:dGTPase